MIHFAVYAQAATPLLTNDWQGAVKLMLALGAVVASIIGALWKFLRSDLQSADKDMAASIKNVEKSLMFDINQLGTRVNEIHTSCAQNATRTDEMRLNLDRAATKADSAITGIQE